MIFRGACLAIFFFTSIVAMPTHNAEAGRAGKAIAIGAGFIGAAILLDQAAKQAKRNRRKNSYKYRNRGKRSNVGSSVNRRKSYSRYTRTQVAQIQLMLNRLGFNAGEPDGYYGHETVIAAKKFQRMLRRRVTGRLTNNERLALIRRADRSNALASAPVGGASGGSGASLQPTSASPPGTTAESGSAEFSLPQRYLIQSKWMVSGDVDKQQGVRTANACAAICDKSSCCQGFVFRSGRCTILKEVKGISPGAQSDLSFVSGIKRENNAAICRL